MIEEKAKVNEMFDGWDKDDEKIEEKPVLELKLPEIR
jgi:hypothetical protein